MVQANPVNLLEIDLSELCFVCIVRCAEGGRIVTKQGRHFTATALQELQHCTWKTRKVCHCCCTARAATLQVASKEGTSLLLRCKSCNNARGKQGRHVIAAALQEELQLCTWLNQQGRHFTDAALQEELQHCTWLSCCTARAAPLHVAYTECSSCLELQLSVSTELIKETFSDKNRLSWTQRFVSKSSSPDLIAG